MIEYSDFLKLKKTLVTILVAPYKDLPFRSAIDDSWAVSASSPKYTPRWHWHNSYIQLEICSLNFFLRNNTWYVDLLPITSKLSAIVVRGTSISPQLYVYNQSSDKATLLPGTSFKDLPWYYIACLVWNAWYWLFIDLALLGFFLWLALK